MTGRYERELVNWFHDAGWGVMRCPASGGSSDRDLPDVLAGRPSEVSVDEHPAAPDVKQTLSNALGIEHKSISSTTAYVDAEEAHALIRFCDRFGAEPRLAVRFTTQDTPTDHYLIHPDDARMTDEGNYGLPVADAEERAAEVVADGEPPTVRRI